MYTADLQTVQSKVNSEPAIIVMSSHKERKPSNTRARPEDDQNDRNDMLIGAFDFSDLEDLSSEGTSLPPELWGKPTDKASQRT